MSPVGFKGLVKEQEVPVIRPAGHRLSWIKLLRALWLIHVPPILIFTNYTVRQGENFYVFNGCLNKQKLFLYTELTDWFVQRR